MTINSEEASESPSKEKSAWLAYTAPMAVFILFTGALEPYLKTGYIWIYSLKILLVTILLLFYRKTWNHELRFNSSAAFWGFLVGLGVFAEWILIDKYIPYRHLGSRAEIDPFSFISNSTTRLLFIAVRFYGLALIVPIMEELFWRSFLLRYITHPDFQQLKLGEYSIGAFWGVAALFSLSHPEWLAAFLCAAAYALLLRKTKSLFACITAHAVTNLTLGIYVLVFHAWKYW